MRQLPEPHAFPLRPAIRRAALIIGINGRRLFYGFKKSGTACLWPAPAPSACLTASCMWQFFFWGMPDLVSLKYLFRLTVLPLMVTPLAAFLVGLPIKIAMRGGKAKG